MRDKHDIDYSEFSEGTNQQTIKTEPPTAEQMHIKMTLICWKCKAIKQFVTTIGVMDLMNKKIRGMQFSSVCENCGAKIGASLDWTEHDWDNV